VSRQQDGLAQVPQAGGQLPRLVASRRVEAGRRLIEKDQVGISHNRESDVQAPQLAARQRPGSGATLADQANELDRLLDAPSVRIDPA
jgi:hypothetical protein